MNQIITIEQANISDCKLLSVLFKTVYIDTYGSEGVTNEFANFIEVQFSPDKIKEDIESKQSLSNNKRSNPRSKQTIYSYSIFWKRNWSKANGSC